MPCETCGVTGPLLTVPAADNDHFPCVCWEGDVLAPQVVLDICETCWQRHPELHSDYTQETAGELHQATVACRGWLSRAPMSNIPTPDIRSDVEAERWQVLDTSDAVTLLAMAAIFEQGLCWTEWRESFPQHYDNIVERTDLFPGASPDMIYAGSLFRTTDGRVLFRWASQFAD